LEEKIVETAKIDMNSEKCAGVYDKKLLWRAQLYIDEGANDWNDVNRWTYTQGNEWDKDWFDSDNDGIIEEAGPYNGGQYNIRPWTHYDDDSSVFITIPYSQGCADSVIHFNLDMDAQASTLTAQGQDPNRENPTLAPEIDNVRSWNNYAFGIQVGEDTARTYDPLIINDTTYYPYTPGFSTASDPYASHLTGYSAGVNCYGFVQRSLAYDNNRYTIPEVGERLIWGGTTPGLIGWQEWQNRSWSFNDVLPSSLVPGDILIIENHVALVVGINYDSNRQYDRENVTIMDSNGVNWFVEKRSWSNFPALTVYRPIFE